MGDALEPLELGVGAGSGPMNGAAPPLLPFGLCALLLLLLLLLPVLADAACAREDDEAAAAAAAEEEEDEDEAEEDATALDPAARLCEDLASAARARFDEAAARVKLAALGSFADMICLSRKRRDD